MAIKLIFVITALCSLAVSGSVAAPSSCDCNDVSSPVCARQGDFFITYINECHAQCHGVTQYSPGTCASQDSGVDCACASNRNPVCGLDGETEYLNACVASRCHGVHEYRLGECGSPPPYLCPCSREYHRVCSHDGEQSYSNPCLARCNGLFDFVDCPRTSPDQTPDGATGGSAACSCLRYALPICADGVDYINPDCAARCHGVTEYTVGECSSQESPPDFKSRLDQRSSDDCQCTLEHNPVCSLDGRNQEYPNPCAARCDGVNQYRIGACDDPDSIDNPRCSCTREYRLVCSHDGEQRFSNPCLARCHGVSDFVRCPEENEVAPPPAEGPGCACNRIYGPVCADGVDYMNADCAVRCHGVTSYTSGRCDGTTGFEHLRPEQLPATHRGVEKKISNAMNLMQKKQLGKKQENSKMIRGG